MAGKGKEVAGKATASKTKKDDTDKSGRRKRKRTGVLQFFDVTADVDDDGDVSDEDNIIHDIMDEGAGGVEGKSDTGKAHNLPVFPKEEELSDDEIEKLLQERYKPGSGKVKYAEDDYEAKMDYDGDSNILYVDDGPPIFKVKCTMGRERHSVFCLMQKYVDLQPLGTKVQVISAFAPEQIKGYIYIEAEKECDVVEACKGLCGIYSSRMSRVPKNELSHLVSLQRKQTGVSNGTWARVKYGNYKGDLAQVVAVDDERKKATVKLVPRVDLQALAKKLNGGINVKQTAVPTPKLISSSELEDFRPHIQFRRDRLTGKLFETLDGLMLKDGYLYKKIAIESLICSGVVPTANELIKFETSKEDTSADMDWLSGLFGAKRKKRSVECNVEKTTKSFAEGKGGKMKGFESSTSGTKKGEGFEVHDLVFFGRKESKDFGIIIGVESGSFKVLKEDSGAAKVVRVEPHEIKKGCSDKKFTGLDKHMKSIVVDDTVRVLEGPFEGRQGIVRLIYRGTLFVYDDEGQLDNDGYFCAKSQLCENVKQFNHCRDKTGEGSGPSGFEESMASPKSPQSPKTPWQAKETNREFNSSRREDRDGGFSIGQTLRIKVGPLKGHLCRVIAIYRSDVTVKLDSQLKVISVKSEHLSEAGVKSVRYSGSSTKPSTDGSGAPAENDGWNSGALSSGRNPWSDSSALLDSTFANSFGATVAKDGSEKDEDNAWATKTIPKKDGDGWDNSVWGNTSNENKAVDLKTNQVGSWGKSSDSWNKATADTGSGSGNHEEDKTWGTKPIPKNNGDSWEKSSWDNASQEDKAVDAKQNQVGNWGNSIDNWGKATANTGSSGGDTSSWDKAKLSIGDGSRAADDSWGAGKSTGGWNTETKQNPPKSSDKGKGVATIEEGTWGKAVETQGNVGKSNQEDSWGKASESWKVNDSTSGGKADGWNTAVGNRGSASGGWAQLQAESGERASDWSKAKGVGQTQSEHWDNANEGKETQKAGSDDWGANNWNKSKTPSADGVSSWSKGNFADKDDEAGGRNQTDSWNKRKGLNEDRGFGWNKRTEAGDSGGDQQDHWGGPKSFDGGRGSGGRRGGRHGGDNFGRGGRSGRGKPWSGDGGSSGWKNSGDERPSWGNASHNAGVGSSNHGDGWNKSKAFGEEDGGSNWNKGGGRDNWSSTKPFGGDQSSNWNKSQAEDRGGDGGFAGNQTSTWDNKNSSWDKPNTSSRKNESQTTNWTGGKVDVNGNRSSGWESKSTQKASVGNQSWGGWNDGSSANGAGLAKDQGDGWGKQKAFDVGSQESGGWQSGANDTSGGWKKNNNDFGREGQQASNWSNSKASNEDQSDNWKGILGSPDKGCGNWRGGKSFNGDRSSGWSSGGTENEGGDASNRGRGRGFGRGGRSSGSDRGGFGNRGGSDRGGFGNRGGSDRGGFGNRGRGRRDQSGSWGRGGPTDNNAGGGWGSTNSDPKEGWNQGSDGGDKGGQWKGGWNKGNEGGGSGNQAGGSGWSKSSGGGGGWNSGGSSWNASGSGKEAGDWNKGGSTKEAGSWNSQGSNWNSGSAKEAGDWNKGGGSTKEAGGGWNSQGSNWNAGDAKESGGWNKGGAGGSSKEAGGGWNSQGSNWKAGVAKESGGWNKGEAGGSSKEAGGGWNGQGSNWKTGGAKESGGWNKGEAGGSSKEAGGGWNSQGSNWNAGSSTPAEGGNKSTTGGMKKEEAGGGGDEANPWGKAAGSSSWGKGTDGSGGW